MDNKRTETYVPPPLFPVRNISYRSSNSLEALSTFIETHRALLARTKSDIERLKALKRQPAEIVRQVRQFVFLGWNF